MKGFDVVTQKSLEGMTKRQLIELVGVLDEYICYIKSLFYVAVLIGLITPLVTFGILFFNQMK